MADHVDIDKHVRTYMIVFGSLLVLTVTNDPNRLARIRKLIAEQVPDGNAYMLFQTWPDFSAPFRPPAPNASLLQGSWDRAGTPQFRIDQV